jgi:hypothetical protein
MVGRTIICALHAAHRIHQLVRIKDVDHNDLSAPALEPIAACITYADGGTYGPTFR